MKHSRVFITGVLNASTPFAVIELICRCHRIKLSHDLDDYQVDQLIHHINQSSAPSVEAYLNPYCKWSLEQRQRGLEILNSWIHQSEIPSQLDPGLITPESLHRHDATILYRLCQLHDISTQRSTTEAQMVQALTHLRDQNRSTLVALVSHQIESMSLTQLASMLTLLPDLTLPDWQFEPNRLQRDLVIPPRSHDQAIVATAIIYSKDISQSRYPLEEYHKISNGNQSVGLDLTNHFNPKLPEFCYDPDNLRRQVIFEGYSPMEINLHGSYLLLQRAYLEPNFHLYQTDFQWTIQQTIYLENISEVDHRQLLGYGIYGEPLQPVTLEELYQSFRTSQLFRNLHDHSFYPTVAINKLAKVSEILHHGLYQTILEIKSKDNNQKSIQDQLVWYCQTGHHDKVVEILKDLLKLGMSMRGWQDGQEYPLEAQKTLTNDPEALNLQVSQYLGVMGDHYASPEGRYLLDSPLMQFDERTHQTEFYKFDGDIMPIIRRLGIISQDGERNSYSCIRSSSNLLLASCYHYLQVIGLPEPFDASKLSFIQ